MLFGRPTSGSRLALLFLLLLTGCAGAPPAASPVFNTPYLVSRDGNVRYRVPTGWFDASADSQETDRAIWLVRGDYAGTLTMHPVNLDAGARADLSRGGLLQIARLIASLETGSKSGFLVHEPESLRVNGTDACQYEVEYGSGEKVRTVLVDTGNNVYAVAAIVKGKSPGETAREIFSIQQLFVNGLRW
jgi:hypothetical protein